MTTLYERWRQRSQLSQFSQLSPSVRKPSETSSSSSSSLARTPEKPAKVAKETEDEAVDRIIRNAYRAVVVHEALDPGEVTLRGELAGEIAEFAGHASEASAGGPTIFRPYSRQGEVDPDSPEHDAWLSGAQFAERRR